MPFARSRTPMPEPSRMGATKGRLLGIDLGARRVGIAVADAATGSVRPLVALRRGDEERDAAVIGRLAQEQGAGWLVVGLPLDMDGSEGPQAALTRAWAEAIAGRLGLPLSLRDERLTSVAAEARLGRAPRGRSGGPPARQARNAYRARVDREAAVAVLQAELDARARSDT